MSLPYWVTIDGMASHNMPLGVLVEGLQFFLKITFPKSFGEALGERTICLNLKS